jgi:hypothetical protein
VTKVDLPPRVAEALRLLAQGHDAKSIAAVTGSTLPAINERLREAGRRMGTTSSREAARIAFGAQEICHEKIDASSGRMLTQRGQSELTKRTSLMSAAGLFIIVAALAINLEHLPSVSSEARVVQTSPAHGSVIAPGPFLLSITYDRAKLADAMSYVQVSPATFPECSFAPILSSDRRTISVRCNAKPNRTYEIWLNRQPYMNFREANGRSAKPHYLRFRVR